MAFLTTLKTFTTVEVDQQGQKTLHFVEGNSVIDLANITAITSFYNSLTGEYTNDYTIGYLDNGLKINIGTPYGTMLALLTGSQA